MDVPIPKSFGMLYGGTVAVLFPKEAHILLMEGRLIEVKTDF